MSRSVMAEEKSTFVEEIHWVFDCYLTLFICCFGIIGNIMSIFVWERLKKKISPVNHSVVKLFKLLAFIDLCVLVLTLFVDFVPTVYPNTKSCYEYIVTFVYIGHPLHFFFLFLSIFSTAAISLDRLKLIYFPLFSMRHGNKISSIFIVTVFALSTVFNIPSFLEYRIVKTMNGASLVKVDYQIHERFRNIVFISHCVSGIVLPWLTICVSNFMILSNTDCRKKRISDTSSSSVVKEEERRQIKSVLLFVTGTCLVMLGFQCVSRCIRMFVEQTNYKWDLVNSVARFGNLAIPLNSALNIVLFCLPGKRFRSELIKMLKEKKKKSLKCCMLILQRD